MLSHVLADIADERERQDTRWGEQNHPDGTRPEFKVFADFAREKTREAAEDGSLTWRHILSEEVAEAYAETDPARLRAELVQVSAVAAAWAEHIDRRQTLAALAEAAMRDPFTHKQQEPAPELEP